MHESPSELIARLQGEREPVRVSQNVHLAYCGSRSGIPTKEEVSALLRLCDRLGVTHVHHGACKRWNRERRAWVGIDHLVALVVKGRRPDLILVEHIPDWEGEGLSAGPKRNAEMARACTDLAWWPGGKGTESCIREFRRAGRVVHSIQEEVERWRRELEQELVRHPS